MLLGLLAERPLRFELIERALYLSIKDRYFNALPTDPTQVLGTFLPDLNNILVGVGKKNPAFSVEKVSSGLVKTDPGLNMSYIELGKKFLTLFRVEFLYSGSTFSITLTRLGMNDFFSNSDLRTIYTFPAFYNYNVFADKLYIYPKPSVTGDLLYGTRANRELLKEKGIRSAFKPLGRKTKETTKQEQYVKRKQRERNKIEGDIGNIKEHYGWNAIKYHYREGSEQWVRFCLLAKNLRLAAARIS